MAWIYLTVAAIFEVGWPLGFKLADLHPHRFGTFISLAAVSMVLSGIFLYLAQRTIPVSTAYIVWTGIGAVATFLIGIVWFGDPASLLRLFFALLILVGIAGLELT
ncbi:MAG: multidrug efflux SMR transporter [Bacteroidales bacterium]|nr:multidrug efflux SMR transporter [Candidatus Equimonas faecalis]